MRGNFGRFTPRCWTGRGVLRASDVPAWEVLCLTYNSIRLAEEEIAKHGLLIPGARGEELVKNPAVSILNQARQQFRLQCQTFGLDPHSRERLGLAVDQGEPDPMEGPAVRIGLKGDAKWLQLILKGWRICHQLN